MKEYDRVELIKDRTEYSKHGVHKGDKGVILGGDRNGYVLVYFDGEIVQDKNGVYCTTEIDVGVRAEDLKLLNEW